MLANWNSSRRLMIGKRASISRRRSRLSERSLTSTPSWRRCLQLVVTECAVNLPADMLQCLHHALGSGPARIAALISLAIWLCPAGGGSALYSEVNERRLACPTKSESGTCSGLCTASPPATNLCSPDVDREGGEGRSVGELPRASGDSG